MSGGPRARVFYPLLLLGALAFAAYVPTLSGDFVLDDTDYISLNPVLAHPRLWHRFFYDPRSHLANPESAAQVYRPVTALGFGAAYLLGGSNPFWYHLFSVFLHAVNTSLVFLLAWTLVGASAGGLWACCGAALLFCLHPAQVESVAYIGSMATVLSLLFCLLSFLCYARSKQAPSGAGNPLSWASAAVFALALLSKESSAFLPPVLAAYDWVWRRDDRGARRRRWPAWPAWAPHAIILVAYLAARTWVLGRLSQRGWWGGSWRTHVAWSVYGLFQDAVNAAWPLHLRVCYSPSLGPGFSWRVAGMALCLFGLLLAAAWGLRRRRVAGFPVFWFLAALAPVSNLVPVDALAADRFLYAPMAGLVLLWALGLSFWKEWIGGLAAAALVVMLAPMCLAQQAAWQNSFVLDLAAHAAAPGDPCTRVHMSVHYYNWGMLDRADDWVAGALDDALPAHLRRSAHFMSGLIAMKAGRRPQASAHFQRILSEDPGRQDVRRLLELCSQPRRAGGGLSAGSMPIFR